MAAPQETTMGVLRPQLEKIKNTKTMKSAKQQLRALLRVDDAGNHGDAHPGLEKLKGFAGEIDEIVSFMEKWGQSTVSPDVKRLGTVDLPEPQPLGEQGLIVEKIQLVGARGNADSPGFFGAFGSIPGPLAAEVLDAEGSTGISFGTTTFGDKTPLGFREGRGLWPVAPTPEGRAPLPANERKFFLNLKPEGYKMWGGGIQGETVVETGFVLDTPLDEHIGTMDVFSMLAGKIKGASDKDEDVEKLIDSMLATLDFLNGKRVFVMYRD